MKEPVKQPGKGPSTALVLGGGGLTAYGWQVGVLAGLADAGLHPGADVLAGTSAGSLLALDLAKGSTPEDLYTEQVNRQRRMIDVDFTLSMTARYLWASLRSRDPDRTLGHLSRLALSVRDVPETAVLEAIGPHIPVEDWPDRPVRLFAVDALTGTPKGFTAADGVDLAHAMAATCALPPLFPPITIGAGRWMDGGVRSTTNADLLADCARVVVLAPIPKAAGATPSARTQVRTLLSQGTRATLLTPDRASLRAFGRNPLNAERIPGAAREGRRQGREYAEAVRAVWE
ncbi:patatin-like phospholipase family protein [Streptomyces parvulus]|uniref:Patatin-like phospholipase family protein n=1 Tax=Streptomyces parvulus TaxID=146923 RepID=A0A369V8T0_9ACTN|nr:patatin-like phospholipase family protein [Streptomyces parvulus]RDD88605.1 patatin-like phospholipase family protein [Streptomyces parvulus]